MFVWSCSLPFLFAFHFPIACILSVTFDALLNSINSIKLRILHLSVPAPCEKCCRVASCGASIPAQAEGPLLQLPSALCPSGGIQALAGPSSALKPVGADLWGKWGLCVGREDKQSSHMQHVLHQSLPYFSQARGSGGGNSALTRAQRAPLQHSHLHVPWGSAGDQSAHAPEQSLSARRCLLTLPACKVRTYPCTRRGIWPYRCLKDLGPELQLHCVGMFLGEVSSTDRVT